MESSTAGKWDSLPITLDENILQTLDELKFTHMTPVQVVSPWHFFNMTTVYMRWLYGVWPLLLFQAACIPLFTSNKDVAAEAVGFVVHLLIKRHVDNITVTDTSETLATSLPVGNFTFRLAVIWSKVTGSGKTLAFVIPILEILQRREEKLKKLQVLPANSISSSFFQDT